MREQSQELTQATFDSDLSMGVGRQGFDFALARADAFGWFVMSVHTASVSRMDLATV